MDCCCGRRSGCAQGLESVAAFARFSCSEFRIGAGVSCGVARRSSDMPDCRSPDACDERLGASTASRQQRHRNSDNSHLRAWRRCVTIGRRHVCSQPPETFAGGHLVLGYRQSNRPCGGVPSSHQVDAPRAEDAPCGAGQRSRHQEPFQTSHSSLRLADAAIGRWRRDAGRLRSGAWSRRRTARDRPAGSP